MIVLVVNAEYMDDISLEVDDSERSIEDINDILTLAKLNQNDLLTTSQTIHFTKNYVHNNQYKFLQLDKHLMESLAEGQSLFIMGDDDESAVICTETRTYDVTETETSNSMLLAENLKFNDDLKSECSRTVSKVAVSGIFCNYIEVQSSKPRLTKLKELLKRTVYKGPEQEHMVRKEDLLSLDDLALTIQASRKELNKTLSSMNAITIKDKIRLLDFEYHFRVLSYMLKLVEENSWELDEVDYEETMNTLSELVPPDILNNLFDLYAEDSKIIDGLQLYRYKEKEVCSFFARVLLYSAGKFNLNEFLQAWKESVPEGMVTSEDMLHTIAIIDRESTPNVIWALHEDELSDNVMDRFKTLFEAKDKWTVAEITPFVEPLATEKCDASALLAKHARASTIQGVKYYSSKQAK